MSSFIWICVSAAIGILCVCISMLKAKNKSSQSYMIIFIAVICAIFSSSVILNTIVYGLRVHNSENTFPFIPTGDLNVWIGYFGSIIGSLIGSITTFIVLSYSIKTQKDTTKLLIEEEKKRTNELIKSERERTREMLESQHMPLISLCFSMAKGYENVYLIENISNSPLLGGCMEIIDKNDNHLFTHVLGNLKSGEPINIIIKGNENWVGLNTLIVRYSDVLGTSYYQTCSIQLKNRRLNIIGPLSVPRKKLNN